jgi:transcription initiation factor TFIIIB Brf1 subunit/transcription initiation factor TFIIB
MIITFDVSSCPDCGGKPELDEKRAELFCKQCGLVIHESLLSTDVRSHLAESILYSPKSRKIHLVMRTSEEKVLKKLHYETGIVNATLGAPAWFVKDVMLLYMELYKKGVTEGKDRLTLISGLFCLLSRREGLPYSNEDIAFASFTKPSLWLAQSATSSSRIGVTR